MGWVTASLLISKLNAMPKRNTPIRAMQEYGRLIKTNFILRYLCNPEFQRQIHRQLNKGVVGRNADNLRLATFQSRPGQVQFSRRPAPNNSSLVGIE